MSAETGISEPATKANDQPRIKVQPRVEPSKCGISRVGSCRIIKPPHRKPQPTTPTLDRGSGRQAGWRNGRILRWGPVLRLEVIDHLDHVSHYEETVRASRSFLSVDGGSTSRTTLVLQGPTIGHTHGCADLRTIQAGQAVVRMWDSCFAECPTK